MALRLTGYRGNYPWWAYTYPLDLRRYRYFYHHANERTVKIELGINLDKVLLSGYNDWENVLIRRFVAIDGIEGEIEEEYWEKGAEAEGVIITVDRLYKEPWESQMRSSWERIFKVHENKNDRIIQASFEELRLEDVVKVTEFTSIPRKKELLL